MSSHKESPIWPIYKRLLKYSARYWPMLLIALVSMIINAGAITAFVKLIKPLLDELFTERDARTIFWMPIWIIGIFAIRGASSFTQRYSMAWVSLQVVQQMRRDIFEIYLHLDSAFFGRESSGQQIARVTYTSSQIASASTSALKTMVTDTLTIIGMIWLMLTTNAYLTLALFLLVPVIALIFTVVSRRYRRVHRRVQRKMGEVTSTVDEAVTGQREVRIYGAQEASARRFFNTVERTRQLTMKVQVTKAASSVAIQTVGAMSLALLVFMATRPGIIGDMTPGDFTRMIMAMGTIMPSMKNLSGVQEDIQKGMAAAQELFQIMDTPQERDTGTRQIERVRGDIRFDDVVMRYPDTDVDVLRRINLACPAGSMTALVGRSGSGKSTLVSLLPRFYEFGSGQIFLDEHPIDSYRLVDLRRQIAWVGQSVVLFDDTVAGNIAYGELAGASEADILAAAEAANAMEFIRKLPKGIHSEVGQGGNFLSGGQRQRIAIARAILKNAPILILDEATSALDTQSERLIQDALERLMKNRTTLVIAHRLSTVEFADQIAVMDAGRVVELGTHAELLAREGHYASLYKMQFHSQEQAPMAPVVS